MANYEPDPQVDISWFAFCLCLFFIVFCLALAAALEVLA